MKAIYLAIGPHCWGKAPTIEKAKRNARRNLFNPRQRPFVYSVYRCHPDTRVDGMGRVISPEGHPPVRLVRGGFRDRGGSS